jgi:hypothetical protein
MKLKFVLITLFICAIGFAQTKGTVTGTLLDKESKNQPLPFANVLIKGTTIGVNTDIDGKYSINLAAGNYTIQFSFVGYENIEMPITVKANETLVINKTLGSGNYTLKDVVVKAKANREKETAILLEQKNAVVIKQSIGAQEMARKGASDVAAAVTKTTGITKQEGSGSIYVRGLGDRYNSTTMNGLPIPSNNPSRKNIKLDMFTTDIVESIGIDKTYNTKNFGDFSGANIDIVSKSYTGKSMMELGFDFGANSQVQNLDHFYLQDGPSKTGFSTLKYPANPLSGYNFKTKLNTTEVNNPFNKSFFVRGGSSFNVGENGKIGIFVTAGFDSDYTNREGISRGAVSVQGLAFRDLTFKSYSYNTNSTAMANLNYKINSNNNIYFNSMFINSSTQNHNEYNGIINVFDIASAGGGFVRRSAYDQTQIIINQFLGKHKFNDRVDFNWGASMSNVKNTVPDRITNTLTPKDNNNIAVLEIANNNDSENNRFYQDLKENELAANISLDIKFNKNSDAEYKGKLTLGYSGRFKMVDFKATQFNFDINTSMNQPVVTPNNLDAYFNQNNLAAGLFQIKTFNGGLKPQTFDGNQYINAGFASVQYQFNPNLTLIVSTRAEAVFQEINWFTNLSPLGKNTFDKIEILPSANLKYSLSEKTNLKFAASKTYTLPQFKERAPFQFEEVTEVTFGNPYLYSSTDYNADLKWEFFPKSNEIISVTAFGKVIQNPINEITVASATNDISYVNTGEKAIVLGAEFEIRKNIFEKTEGNKSSLSTGFNASYMYNNQDFDNNKVIKETDLNVYFSKEEGGLTGASDLLLNGDVSYFKGFSNNKNILATLTYNYFSDRIYALGTGGRGDLIDKAVNTVDFILKSALNKKLSLGLTIKNILDPKVERIQEDQNVIVETYKKGVNFKLSVAYKF